MRCLALIAMTVAVPVLSVNVWSSEPVAIVNGQEITADDLQLDFFMRQLSAASTQVSEQQLLERLIDRELIRQFLKKRRVEADPFLLQQQLEAIDRLIAQKGDERDAVLEKLGMTDESLRELLSLPIAWNRHVNRILTATRLQRHWETYQERFDGTQVTASQIFLKRPSSEDPQSAESVKAKLQQVREQIQSGKISFEEAAQKFSESPSAEKGGALGTFEFYGQVAEPIAMAAFGLTAGEISEVVESPMGFHLISVQERTNGALSLEDGRPELVRHLSQELWNEQVARERQTARIKVLSSGP